MTNADIETVRKRMEKELRDAKRGAKGYKEAALKRLVDAGIVTRTGKLAKAYR